MKIVGKTARLAWLLACCASATASAQTLPAEPIAFGDGMITLGGDVSASFAREDPGFFNYTDYERSALRLFRVDLTGSVRAGDHVTLLGELRSENLGRPQAYALYLRLRPWLSRAFDIQVGRVPPTFGAFARRTYARDNPLIGYPLGYQYLTSLRPDAVPATADELLLMRGRGWRSSFSVGNPKPDRGVPFASAFRWDTGVQVHAATSLVEAAAAVTTGTLSNPLFTDDNSGRQLAGRVALHPVAGLIVGGSAARGPFLTTAAARATLGDGLADTLTQTAWGVDVEYSRDYYLIRMETIVSRWALPPMNQPVIDSPLGGISTSVEGRYKFRPGLYGAARIDHLAFTDVIGSSGPAAWEAPVTRVEVGGGYSLLRNLLMKLSFQYNRRDTVRVPTVALVAAELIFWF